MSETLLLVIIIKEEHGQFVKTTIIHIAHIIHHIKAKYDRGLMIFILMFVNVESESENWNKEISIAIAIYTVLLYCVILSHI